MTALCVICHRNARGFGFKPPQQRADFLGVVVNPRVLSNISVQRFCSMTCQSIFYQLFTQEIMVNKTDLEIKAAQSVLAPLGDYVANIGMHVPLSHYSTVQITGLVETVLDHYHSELQRLTQDEIPF